MKFHYVYRVTLKNYMISRCFWNIFITRQNIPVKGRPVAQSSLDVTVLPKAMLSFQGMPMWKDHFLALTMGHSCQLGMQDIIERLVDKVY